MTDPLAQPAQRSEEIDVLRGFAILAVLLLHAGVMTDGLAAYPHAVSAVQRLSTGIQLFFVISGFLISASLDRCRLRGEGVKGFLIRRAAKIAPLYLVFLHLNIAVFIVTRLLAPELAPFRNSPTDATLTWSNYVVHLAFLQGFIPANLHTLLDGSWSIVIEVYFYVTFALLLSRWTRTALGSVWVYVGSLAAAIAFVVLIGRHVSGYSHQGFLAQLPCFLLGVLAHRLRAAPDFDKRFAPWGKAVVAACVLLMLGLIKGESKPLGDFTVYALAFTALLLASSAVMDLLPRFASRALATIGRQSYALFFVHLLLLKGCYVLLAANQVALPFGTALALNVVVAVPLSWLVATLVFDRIDRYFVALAGRSLGRNTDKPIHWSQA